MEERGRAFWVLQGFGWLLFAYLVYAQVIAAFDYTLGVAMGTQEPAEQITEVGVAFSYGFAFADLVVYVPLLACGLVAHSRGLAWGRVPLAAALGISAYWPVVCLAAVVDARNAPGWALSGEAAYWVVLPVISLWGVWGLWHVAHCAPGEQ